MKQSLDKENEEIKLDKALRLAVKVLSKTIADNNVLSTTLLIALRSLATNEANAAILKTSGVVPSLLAFIRARREDLLLRNIETTEQVLRAVWVLSFQADFRQQLRDGGVIELIKSTEGYVSSCEEEGSKAALNGALWTLAAEGQHALHAGTTTAPGSGKHIMVSYSWGQKDRMRQLSAFLQRAGFTVWIDVEQMEGSVLQAMAEAIEEASVVIVGLSSTYKESQACRTEAEYAYSQKKSLVFVQAEDGYAAKGWLGALLGNQLWYNPWMNEGGFDAGAETIVKNLRRVSSASSQQASAGGTLPRPPASVSATSPSHKHAVPANLEPLSGEELTREQAVLWDTLKVLRWLRTIAAEDDYLAAFLAHRVTGEGLLELNRSGSHRNFLAVLDHMGLHAAGPALKFHGALRQLLDPSKGIAEWNTSKVLAWLEKAGLTRVLAKAREDGWKGKTLVGLHEGSRDDAFESVCKRVGVEGSADQLELQVALKNLFF